MLKYIIIVVSILLTAQVAEARNRSSGSITHEGYNRRYSHGTHRIRPTVPLGQGNELSNYESTRGWVQSFPSIKYIERRRDEQGH